MQLTPTNSSQVLLDPSAVETMQHLALKLRSTNPSTALTERIDALANRSEENIVAVYNRHLQLQAQFALAEKHFSEKETLLTKTISDLKTQIASQEQTIGVLKKEIAEAARKADERVKAALAAQTEALRASDQAHKSELNALKQQLRTMVQSIRIGGHQFDDFNLQLLALKGCSPQCSCPTHHASDPAGYRESVYMSHYDQEQGYYISEQNLRNNTAAALLELRRNISKIST